MDLHDRTDYRFATSEYKLLVRQVRDATADLRTVAQRHAEQIQIMLGATNVVLSATETLPGGTQAVRVMAQLPGAAATEPAPLSERTAFLAFAGGLLVQLSFLAPTGDARAEAEFTRLLHSVRPAVVASPLDAVARTLAAGTRGAAAYPVGDLRIDLTPAYQAPATFTLASADHRVTHTLERASDPRRSSGALYGSRLATGSIGTAVAEDGRPLRYEIGPKPWLSPGPGSGPANLVEGTGAARMRSFATTASAQPGAASATVGGVPVMVRTTVRDASLDAAAQGQDFLRTLKSHG